MRSSLLLNITFRKSRGGSKANWISDFRGFFPFTKSKWGKCLSLQGTVFDDSSYLLLVVKVSTRIYNEGSWGVHTRRMSEVSGHPEIMEAVRDSSFPWRFN